MLPNSIDCTWNLLPSQEVSDPEFRLEIDELDLEGQWFDHLYILGCNTSACDSLGGRTSLYALSGRASEPFYIVADGFAAISVVLQADEESNSKGFKLRYSVYEKGACLSCIKGQSVPVPKTEFCLDIPVVFAWPYADAPHIGNASQPRAVQRFFSPRSPTPILSLIQTSVAIAARGAAQELAFAQSILNVSFTSPTSSVELSVRCPDDPPGPCAASPSAWESFPTHASSRAAALPLLHAPADLISSVLPFQRLRTLTLDADLGVASSAASLAPALPARFELALRATLAPASKPSLSAFASVELAAPPPPPQPVVTSRRHVSALHARYRAADFEPNTQVPSSPVHTPFPLLAPIVPLHSFTPSLLHSFTPSLHNPFL